MSFGLTQQQSHLLKYIENFSSEKGFCPSYRQMMAALELNSVSGIARLIDGLEERGLIRRLRDRARAIVVCRDAPAQYSARELKVGLAKYSIMDLRRELVRRQEGADS